MECCRRSCALCALYSHVNDTVCKHAACDLPACRAEEPGQVLRRAPGPPQARPARLHAVSQWAASYGPLLPLQASTKLPCHAAAVCYLCAWKLCWAPLSMPPGALSAGCCSEHLGLS